MAVVDVSLSLPFTLVALFVIAVAGTDVTVLIGARHRVLGAFRQAGPRPGAQPARLAVCRGGAIGRCVGLADRGDAYDAEHRLADPGDGDADFSNLILLKSALSFLGLGVQPPTATLGSIVGRGSRYMASAAWIVAAPAGVIVLVSLAVMLLGDFLRDHFDVKLRDR